MFWEIYVMIDILHRVLQDIHKSVNFMFSLLYMQY